MNDSKLAPNSFTRQADPPEARKIGVEVVKSANVSSRFFRVSRRNCSFPIFDDNEFWAHRLEEAVR